MDNFSIKFHTYIEQVRENMPKDILDRYERLFVTAWVKWISECYLIGWECSEAATLLTRAYSLYFKKLENALTGLLNVFHNNNEEKIPLFSMMQISPDVQEDENGEVWTWKLQEGNEKFL